MLLLTHLKLLCCKIIPRIRYHALCLVMLSVFLLILLLDSVYGCVWFFFIFISFVKIIDVVVHPLESRVVK